MRTLGWGAVRWAFTAAPGGAYQPLAFLSYALDYSLWGLDPRGYHLGNVLLHALNAGLFCLAARKIIERAAPRAAGEPDWALDAAALFSALAFALHPLRVESVSWAAERRDALCGAFWLGAILAYLRARQAHRPARGLGLVLALFSAACLTKGLAVTLPLILLLLDAWPLRRPLRGAILEKIPMLALGAALGALAIAAQGTARASWSWTDHAPAARAAQSLYALVFYALKTAWPEGLSPFYELRAPLDPFEARFILAAVAVAAFAVVAWRWRRKNPALALAGACYAVALAPVSGVLQAGAQLVADRYSYLACLPWALLAGGVLRRVLVRPRARWGGAAAASLILMALAAACVAQQSHWKDSEALWGRALAQDPRSPTAWNNLGSELAQQSRAAEAAEAFDRALSADPSCRPLLERLARGDQSAVVRAALEIRPVCRHALTNAGTARAALGEYGEARALLALAATVDPQDATAAVNLARVQALLRRR